MNSTSPIDVRIGTAPTPPADFDLVLARARAGDPQAFGTVYERYVMPIYRFYCRRLNDSDVAADLTADVFMRVYQAIQAGRAWQDSFVSWLYQIARNRLVDHIRFVARRPQCELSDSLPGPDEAQLDERIEQQLVMREVEAALGRIRPEYAHLLRLRFQNDLAHAESGVLLNKRASAVKVSHHRAVKALRQQLVGNVVAESWLGNGGLLATA